MESEHDIIKYIKVVKSGSKRYFAITKDNYEEYQNLLSRFIDLVKFKYDYFEGLNYGYDRRYSGYWGIREVNYFQVHSLNLGKVNNPYSLTLLPCSSDIVTNKKISKEELYNLFETGNLTIHFNTVDERESFENILEESLKEFRKNYINFVKNERYII